MSIGGGGTGVGPLIDALDVKFMAAFGQNADGISRIVLLEANDAGIVGLSTLPHGVDQFSPFHKIPRRGTGRIAGAWYACLSQFQHFLQLEILHLP